MKRNGHDRRAHLVAVYPPALAHQVERPMRVGEAACDACGTPFDPLIAGEPGGRRPGSSPVPLCGRCATTWHAEAA